MSFLADYFGVPEGSEETQVLCPLWHHTESGLAYKESHPSAHVNTVKHVYHCKACGEGLSEAQFIEKICGCKGMDAMRIRHMFDTEETAAEWEQVIRTKVTNERALGLGFSQKVIDEIEIKSKDGLGDLMCFPVIMFGHVCDIRTYNPGTKPKVRSRAGCASGLVIPFDIWKETPTRRVTLICAGEKDMAIARSYGFNAITITGGEERTTLVPEFFRDRKVAIVYDNDGAGFMGAKRLANQLYNYTHEIKIVTGFHEICKNKGEDIWDFFMTYHKTKDDLIQYIESTPNYIPTAEEERAAQKFKQMTLLEASSPSNIGKLVQSNIQVVAVHDTTFAAAASAIATKYRLSGKESNDTMPVGEVRTWEYCDDKAENILELIDNNFSERDVEDHLKALAKVPFGERCVSVKILDSNTVFKCSVTDMFETTNAEYQPMEFTAYSIGHKLESGKKYLVTYKLVPHPYKGQQLAMLIVDSETANDSVANFSVTDSVKENLNEIRSIKGSVEDKVNIMTQKVKGLLGYDGNDTLIQAIDLAYNTALEFNFGKFKNVRAYLDTIIVGESRVGKSSTADCLRKTYELGTFTSLAGNSATLPGLIGGSNKTSSGFQTRAGIIPQNHRGLIIFEEFGKSNSNIAAELTDIRSSNEVRITRVSGTITLPAMVRMISLTNVKNTGNTIKPIAAYPHGISIITELVNTAEDIARYDMIVILPDRGASQIDPLWEPEKPFDKKVYQDRIRWIWSRTPEQIRIDPGVSRYIVDKANELNKDFDCHIKIFGTEAWKKIARLAIAVAGYTVSTDDFQTLIVRNEHVDYAVNFLKRIYDNSTFKLREYTAEEREYSTVSQDAIDVTQDMYTKSPGMILQLERSAGTTRNILQASTGMTADELNKGLTLLMRKKLIRMEGNEIYPTERFRKSVQKINRDTVVERIAGV